MTLHLQAASEPPRIDGRGREYYRVVKDVDGAICWPEWRRVDRTAVELLSPAHYPVRRLATSARSLRRAEDLDRRECARCLRIFTLVPNRVSHERVCGRISPELRRERRLEWARRYREARLAAAGPVTHSAVTTGAGGGVQLPLAVRDESWWKGGNDAPMGGNAAAGAVGDGGRPMRRIALTVSLVLLFAALVYLVTLAVGRAAAAENTTYQPRPRYSADGYFMYDYQVWYGPEPAETPPPSKPRCLYYGYPDGTDPQVVINDIAKRHRPCTDAECEDIRHGRHCDCGEFHTCTECAAKFAREHSTPRRAPTEPIEHRCLDTTTGVQYRGSCGDQLTAAVETPKPRYPWCSAALDDTSEEYRRVCVFPTEPVGDLADATDDLDTAKHWQDTTTDMMEKAPRWNRALRSLFGDSFGDRAHATPTAGAE